MTFDGFLDEETETRLRLPRAARVGTRLERLRRQVPRLSAAEAAEVAGTTGSTCVR